ncbi:tripartite tricarboxylate transporter substrate binding protein [Siccirubricoccus sp. KC 17139]|uniref:Tripartite tricarboxylate transporter substrate binding protein n=1 Tax=Siccirubricoccus soli TaxID=2899147 RepID=A0ABT1D400_9PROT|nr:tripartite tricarboxylate transporter substrate binding protein [Siccirubricoccus soli]MCO6416599.1 tripartite tricarboxylate transporter substrate binding protein [Siccirubricoccus soli]MCP2682734.1 tripartite tricarboxylate transporter substrate binding protein [Siccirubricoccus soli]
MPKLARRAVLTVPLALPALAIAQARTITWIVPFAAGGITDTSARVTAQRMAQSLSQQIGVENRPGAGGTIGAEAVARAAPDGLTLLYGSQGPIAAAPALYPSLRYDPLRDLAPVHGLGASPHLIVSAPGKPWQDLAGLVARAKAAPETLTYASSGVGTSPHLAGEALQQATGVKLTHIPYANGTQALNDVIAGRVDVIWDYPLVSLPHVREGRLRALAVTDHGRVSLARDVPTVAEAGLPGAELVPWAALFTAPRTPPETVARLAAALRETLHDPKVREFFEGTGTVLWPQMGTAELAGFLQEELPRIAGLIARSGARAG